MSNATCKITPCLVKFCHVTLCQVTPCHFTPCQVAPCKVPACQPTFSQVTPCHVTPCLVTPCQISIVKYNPCKVPACHVTLCKVRPCKSNLVGSQGTPCQVTSQLAKLDLCKVPVFQVELCNVPTWYVTLYKVPACHVILKVPGCHVTPYLLKPQLARFDPCSPQLPTYCFFPYRYHCHLESSWSLSSNPRKSATKLLPKTRWSTPNQNLRNGPNSATTWRSCRNRKSQNRSACRKRRRGNRGKARHSWNGFKRRKMVKKVEVSPPPGPYSQHFLMNGHM